MGREERKKREGGYSKTKMGQGPDIDKALSLEAQSIVKTKPVCGCSLPAFSCLVFPCFGATEWENRSIEAPSWLFPECEEAKEGD